MLSPAYKLLLLSIGVAACHPASTPLSVAYIRSTQVMQQYHGTLAKRQQLATQASKWEHSLDSLSTAIGATHLSATDQETQVARYRSVLQQKVQAASQQADQELLKEVNQYLQEYGKSQQYDFILGANESGNIVYATAAKDITKQVLEGLNQHYDQQHPTASKQE